MSAQPHTIMLNGKQFDVVSGKPLGTKHAKPVHHHKAITQTSTPARHAKVIDGFTKKPQSTRTTQPKVAHTVHKQPEHSKTLMRKVVKRPAPVSIKHTAPKPAPSHPDLSIISHTAAPRALRADHIQKSRLISRFGTGNVGPKVIKTILPVQPVPEDAPPMSTILPSHAIPSISPLGQALEQATSHHQKLKKTPRRHKVARKLGLSPKALNVSSAALAVVVIGMYVAYQNLPNLSLRMAAAKAGIHASLPSYKPVGFSLAGPIKYEPGGITLSYKSNSSDSRAFQVSQKKSEWNSDALLQNFVATANRAYQSYQDSGKTIYIYEGDNATWVDGGIWYQIEGKASLNSDQLLRIAKSL